jgi:ribonuclease PH
MTIPRDGRVSTLWNLIFNGNRVSCVVYHGADGMELRLESTKGTILTEPFDMQPRSLSRTKALRDSLKRRGWREMNPNSQ